MAYAADQLPGGLDAAAALAGTDVIVGAQGGDAVGMLVSQVMTAVLALLGDTDGTLAANSDSKLATQKAVVTYVAARIAAALASADAVLYKGVIDCSANPNYPAADAGFLYVVSVAGKIGGASGTSVSAGDLALCKADSTASGNQATVGSAWDVVPKGTTAPVTSVAGKTGAVTLDHSDLADFVEAVQDVVGAFLSAANGVRAVYDDAGNTLSLDAAEAVNLQTGTSYTLVTGDRGNLVNLANAGAIALTIPQAGSTGFPLGWWCDIEQGAAGAVTGTPTTSTVDGAATVATTTAKQGFRLVSDGTNWYTIRGIGGGTTFTGGTLTSALNEATPVSIAAAGTMNIGAAAANTITVTGSSGPITAFDTIAAGARRELLFASTPTWTHNATSMILPGGANIVLAAGDRAEVISLGSGNWECVFFQRAASLGSGGGGAFTYSSSAPGSPAVGDRWVDSANGILLTYINDGTTSQWVEF